MTDKEIIEMAHQAGITYVTGYGVASATFEWLAAFASLVAAREREACAKLCDGWTHADGDRCAEAIRGRGEK